LKLQITVDGRTYEVEVDLLEEEEGSAEPRATYSAPAPSPPPPLPPQPAIAQSNPAPATTDAKVCRSPVMGLVIKVNVEPGQTVEAGELVLVLEAMKMETNVMAPEAGTVKAVLVKPGEPVKLNQPLLEFE
jgi:methylmalonyl-CoA carboxyltransferase small subunit